MFMKTGGMKTKNERTNETNEKEINNRASAKKKRKFILATIKLFINSGVSAVYVCVCVFDSIRLVF